MFCGLTLTHATAGSGAAVVAGDDGAAASSIAVGTGPTTASASAVVGPSGPSAAAGTTVDGKPGEESGNARADFLPCYCPFHSQMYLFVDRIFHIRGSQAFFALVLKIQKMIKKRSLPQSRICG